MTARNARFLTADRGTRPSVQRGRDARGDGDDDEDRDDGGDRE